MNFRQRFVKCVQELFMNFPEYQVDIYAIHELSCRHTASYESLLNKAPLPSLEVRRQMNIAIQTFKIRNDLSPTYLLELIEKRCRTRNLRNSENILKIPLMKRVRHGTNSFCFLVPEIWNSSPGALRITRDLKTFRDGLRAFFFNLIQGTIEVGPLTQ